MKRWLLALLLVLPALSPAQVHSIAVSAEAAFGLARRSGVDHARGTGATAGVRFRAGDLLIGIGSGYASYRIDETDQLNRWGWNFWNDRYLPKIQSDMRADPNLSGQIGSVQSMDLIPVALTVAYPWELSPDLRILPGGGGGVAFFTRKLYANETWTKRYPQSAYVLTYNLRNFAPEKKGRSYFLEADLEVLYMAGAGVEISAGIHARQYLTAVTGSGLFPFTTALGGSAGVTFTY